MSPGNRPMPIFSNTGHAMPISTNPSPKMIKKRDISTSTAVGRSVRGLIVMEPLLAAMTVINFPQHQEFCDTSIKSPSAPPQYWSARAGWEHLIGKRQAGCEVSPKDGAGPNR
jgi:hypothetical protein